MPCLLALCCAGCLHAFVTSRNSNALKHQGQHQLKERSPSRLTKAGWLSECCSLQGEQVTWAKLSAIQANCGIEMTLDACMLRLSEVIAAQRQVQGLYRVAKNGRTNGMRQRIPSWINMSSMGEPPRHCGAKGCGIVERITVLVACLLSGAFLSARLTLMLFEELVERMTLEAFL